MTSSPSNWPTRRRRDLRPVDRRAHRHQARAISPSRTSPAATSAWKPRRHALEAAGRQASDIDLIIVATSTPDMVFPSTAAILQNKLGIAGCAAFDVQAVCSGFVYALTVADAMIRTGAARKALVIGAEVFSRILDFNDRTTCVLFGDGAGAVVLEASERARHPGQRAACRRQPRRHPLRARPRVGRASAGQAAAEHGRPGRVQARGRRARRRCARHAGQGRQDRRRHRLADSAPGQHPHHARHGQEAEAAAATS